MAPFNPSVPATNEQAQAYLRGFSRPVEAPSNIRPTGVEPNQIYPEGVKVADRSAEYAGEAAKYNAMGQGSGYQTFGDLFSGVVAGADLLTKAGDTLIKKDIENTVYAQANSERERYTDQLEAIKAGVNPGLQGTKSIMDANASMDTPGQDKANMPTELTELPDNLDIINGARMHSKLNNTDYWRNLDTMARDLRTRYPGYAEYIDQQFAKVTGQVPANARVNQLVSAINQSMTNANSERTRAFGELIKILPDLQPEEAKMWIGMVDSGQAGMADVMKRGINILKGKADSANRAQMRQEFEGDDVLWKKQATQDAQWEASNFVRNFTDGIMHQNGVGFDEDYRAFMNKGMTNGFSSTESIQQGNLIKSREVEMAQGLRKLMNTPQKDLGGRSFAQVAGIDQVNSIIDYQTKYLRDLGEFVSRGQYSLADDAKRTADAQVDDTRRAMLAHPSIGPVLVTSQAIQKSGGNQAMDGVLKTILNDPKFPDQLKGWYSAWWKTAATGVSKNGKPPSINDFAEDAKTQNLADYGKGNSAMVDMVRKTILTPDSTPEMKQNAIKFMFGPRSQGFVESIAKDDRDTQMQTFLSLTTDQMAKAAYKTGPEYFKNYQDWTLRTARNLFSEDVANINDLTANANAKVSWNPTAQRFIVERNLQPGMRPAEANVAYNRVQRGFERINNMLTSIKNMAGQDPNAGDVESFLMKSLMTMGWQPSGESRINNLPDVLAKTIIEQRQAQDAPKPAPNKPKGESSTSVQDTTRSEVVDMDKLKKMFPNVNNYMPEEDNSVQGWMRNLPQQQPQKKVFNYSNEPLLGIQTQDVPENMSPQEFINAAKTYYSRKKNGSK